MGAKVDSRQICPLMQRQDHRRLQEHPEKMGLWDISVLPVPGWLSRVARRSQGSTFRLSRLRPRRFDGVH